MVARKAASAASTDHKMLGIRWDGTVNLPLLLGAFIGVVIPINSYILAEARRDEAMRAKVERIEELVIDNKETQARLNRLEATIDALRRQGGAL